MTREQKLKIVWRTTHRDFKGKRADGVKCVLVFEPGVGTCLAPLDSLTDEQINSKLPKEYRA